MSVDMEVPSISADEVSQWKRRSNMWLLICRICLKPQKSMCNIFECYKNNQLISDMLTECTTIKVRKDDDLPENICNFCLAKLNVAYDFKSLAIASDRKLQNFSPNNTAEHNYDILNHLAVIKDEKFDPYDNDDSQNIMFNASIINNNTTDKEVCNMSEKRKDECSVSLIENEHIKQVVIKEEEREEQEGELQENYDGISLSTDASDVGSDESSSRASTDKIIKKNYSINKEELSKDSLIIENSDKFCHVNDKVTGEEINEKNMEQASLSEDEVECNFPAELFDTSEYEKLKSLSKAEKRLATLSCKLCNKSFSYRYFIKVHLKKHTGDIPHKCEICGKCFPMPYLLRAHKKKHTDSKPCTCEVCGKSFKHLGALRSHQPVHSNDFPHKCDLCDKSFKRRNSLNFHLQIHKGEKAFVCDTCGKGFNTQTALYNHKFTHNTENSFTCTTCGKSYKSKRHLTVHTRIHSDVKPHVCSYCDKGFHSTSTLRKHVLIHTGEKPYSCKICGKTFRQDSCVSLHMRTHTGETPYACEQCPMKYKYSQHLQSHMKVHK